MLLLLGTSSRQCSTAIVPNEDKAALALQIIHSFTHDVFEQGHELGTVSRTRTYTAATTSALGLFTTKDDASPIEITGLLTLYQAQNEERQSFTMRTLRQRFITRTRRLEARGSILSLLLKNRPPCSKGQYFPNSLKPGQ